MEPQNSAKIPDKFIKDVNKVIQVASNYLGHIKHTIDNKGSIFNSFNTLSID